MLLNYSGLTNFFQSVSHGVDVLTLKFHHIEAITGPLPLCARKHRAWWRNEADSPRPQAQSWMDAGFRVSRIYLASEIVTFERHDGAANGSSTEEASPFAGL